MRYEVRYQIGGEEHTTEVDVDDAATAAAVVQDQFLGTDHVFELLQVHLLDDMPEPVFESEATS